MIRRTLKGLEYKVEIAKTGFEAIKIYKNSIDNIDLILLDLIMPELTGKETYKVLKEINPDIKIILMSGISENAGITDKMEIESGVFIQNPFKRHELSKIIHNVIYS